jgi:DNA-binding CsgD family transcriptional regulator
MLPPAFPCSGRYRLSMVQALGRRARRPCAHPGGSRPHVLRPILRHPGVDRGCLRHTGDSKTGKTALPNCMGAAIPNRGSGWSRAKRSSSSANRDYSTRGPRGRRAARRGPHPGWSTGSPGGRRDPPRPISTGSPAAKVDVLRVLSRGLSKAEIAAELFIGETTIKTHVARVAMKLGLRERVQAASLAHDAGLRVRPGRVRHCAACRLTWLSRLFRPEWGSARRAGAWAEGVGGRGPRGSEDSHIPVSRGPRRCPSLRRATRGWAATATVATFLLAWTAFV